MVTPTFSTKQGEKKMADLNVPEKKDIKPSEPGKKIKRTDKKPIPGDHIKNTQIQVHRGNVDILSLQFLEKIAQNTFMIAKHLEGKPIVRNDDA